MNVIKYISPIFIMANYLLNFIFCFIFYLKGENFESKSSLVIIQLSLVNLDLKS